VRTTATLKAAMQTLALGRINLLDRHFRARGSTNSPPGTYTGSISINADQGNATIPVTLTVWNFELHTAWKLPSGRSGSRRRQ